MSKKHRGRYQGDPVTYQLPSPAGGVQLETFVPWTLVKRGLRKQIITPLDAPQEFMEEARRERQARESAQDSALLRALGLAYHWQRLLDEQRVGSVAEIAEAEEINVTQVRRLMRLTLLAPAVVEQLVGTSETPLEQLMRCPWPTAWKDQIRVPLKARKRDAHDQQIDRICRIALPESCRSACQRQSAHDCSRAMAGLATSFAANIPIS